MAVKKQAESGKLANTLVQMKANKTKGIMVITPYSSFRNQEIIKDMLE